RTSVKCTFSDVVGIAAELATVPVYLSNGITSSKVDEITKLEITQTLAVGRIDENLKTHELKKA
ncbi:hypothetical protein HAX54_041664, partial [Datura stramonium]|nr:hypothetical protein [Datura stramonium]